jgi:Cu/Ag efflux protein CusF
MKTILKTAITLTAALATAYGASAAEFTKAKVKKVDMKSEKVTLIHEPLKNLDMPAMTMVFKVADKAMLGKLKEGAQVEFVADRVNGKLTITEVK